MSKATGIRITSSLFLLLICSNQSVLANAVFRNSDQLFEGNECRMENGAGNGVCKRVTDCPARVEEIRKGSYSQGGRCGFDNFEEIFCCPTSVPERSERLTRRAHAACENYKEIVNALEDSLFHTVVINGVRAKSGEFPHMAALGYVASKEEGYPGDMKYICGGTLISQNHVLTAAHCVSNIHGLVPSEVMLGTIDVDVPNKNTVQRIAISRIIEHPEYRTGVNYNDVAILVLQNLVKYTAYVHPTCLLTNPVSNMEKRLVILGWGAIDLDGTTSTKLLKAEGLKIVETTDCSRSYKNVQAQIPRGLDDGMICVGDPNTTRNADTCWGDSGGPLLVSSTKFAPLVGITSFGQACGGRTPGVYASVYKYLSWIEDEVWPNYK